MKGNEFLAGLAIVATVLFGGCATEHYEMDAKHPAASMTDDGTIYFRGRAYDAESFPQALKKAHIPTDREINIRVPDTVSSANLLRRTRALLGRAGYRRPIFVTEQKSKSYQADGVDPTKNSGRNFAPGEKVYGAGW